MNMLLQMDIDLIERLSATIKRFREDKNTPYSESSLKEAENEIARIIQRMESKYDSLEEYEKHIANEAIKKVQTYYKIKIK